MEENPQNSPTSHLIKILLWEHSYQGLYNSIIFLLKHVLFPSSLCILLLDYMLRYRHCTCM